VQIRFAICVFGLLQKTPSLLPVLVCYLELPAKFLLVVRMNKPLFLDIIKVNSNSQDHHFGGERESHFDVEVR
jgi:hypothetical protein